MLTIAKAPETQMTAEQTTDNQKNNDYQPIGTTMTTLQGDVTTLSNPSFYQQSDKLNFGFFRGQRDSGPRNSAGQFYIQRYATRFRLRFK